MSYKLELSTRPAKALGDMALWDQAEGQLEEALNEFAGVGNWKVNAGDGAFYGPKIDIQVFDALERVHQCATVQLDFQLPIRFNLEYTDSEQNFSRPVMVHRAMLGSVERMAAVLTEHWGGKWPFWVSPRQCIVVPVGPSHIEYAKKVRAQIRAARFYVDCDDSGHTLPKKIRNAQLAQYNFILVVGDNEIAENAVAVRTRANTVEGTMPVSDFIARCVELRDTKAKDPPPPD